MIKIQNYFYSSGFLHCRSGGRPLRPLLPARLLCLSPVRRISSSPRSSQKTNPFHFPNSRSLQKSATTTEKESFVKSIFCHQARNLFFCILWASLSLLCKETGITVFGVCALYWAATRLLPLLRCSKLRAEVFSSSKQLLELLLPPVAIVLSVSAFLHYTFSQLLPQL